MWLVKNGMMYKYNPKKNTAEWIDGYNDADYSKRMQRRKPVNNTVMFSLQLTYVRES